MKFWPLLLLMVLALALYQQEIDLEQAVHVVASVHPTLLLFLYIIAVILLLPLSPFPLAAGLSLGFWSGALLSLVALNIGSLLAFWLGKYVFQPYLQSMQQEPGRITRMMQFVSKDQLTDIVLLRINPMMPFSLHNYLYGVCNSNMRLGRYILGTFLGSLPFTLLLVYLGFAGRMLFVEGVDSGGFTLLVILATALSALLIAFKYHRDNHDDANGS